MERNGTQWSAMERNGAQWTAMDRNEPQWSAMERNGAQWTAMERNGPQWSVMDRNGAQWSEQMVFVGVGSSSISGEAFELLFVIRKRFGRRAESLSNCYL